MKTSLALDGRGIYDKSYFDLIINIVKQKTILSNRHSFERQSCNNKKVDLVQVFTLIVITFLLMIIVKQVYIILVITFKIAFKLYS